MTENSHDIRNFAPSSAAAPLPHSSSMSNNNYNNSSKKTEQQIKKLKDANAKYKDLLKLAKERIQSQEEELERIKVALKASQGTTSSSLTNVVGPTKTSSSPTTATDATATTTHQHVLENAPSSYYSYNYTVLPQPSEATSDSQETFSVIRVHQRIRIDADAYESPMRTKASLDDDCGSGGGSGGGSEEMAVVSTEEHHDRHGHCQGEGGGGGENDEVGHGEKGNGNRQDGSGFRLDDRSGSPAEDRKQVIIWALIEYEHAVMTDMMGDSHNNSSSSSSSNHQRDPTNTTNHVATTTTNAASTGFHKKRFQRWRKFNSENELLDHVRRNTGEPIHLPPYSLSPAQSQRIENEAKQAVAHVTEEFRRFRVRAEVARKQTDATLRALQSNKVQNAQRHIEGEDIASELEQARWNKEQLRALRIEFAEQEAQWKEAYDVLLNENNALKSAGSEAFLAAQWRQRYENCVMEKEKVSTALEIEKQKFGNGANGRQSQNLRADDEKYEKKYRDLKESFRLYRKKAKEIFEAQQKGEMALLDMGDTQHSSEDPKLCYLRNLMVNYLSSDPSVREHMEGAIGTVLKFSSDECARIAKQKKLHREASASWFGS